MSGLQARPPGGIGQPARGAALPQLLPDGGRHRRHERLQHDGDNTDDLRKDIQDRLQASDRAALGQLPRRLRLNVAVGMADQREDHFQRVREIEDLHGVVDLLSQCQRLLSERLIIHRAAHRSRHRNAALRVPLDHRQRAVDQIAQVVGQVRVQPHQDRVLGKRAVLPERHLAQEEVAVDVGGIRLMLQELPDDDGRVHNVAQRLRHLLLADLPPPVRDNHPRHLLIGKPQRMQDDRPIDGVVSQDVFADEVRVRRPDGAETLRVHPVAGHADVVEERIEPHVRHVRLAERNRNPPAHPLAGTRDAQVFRQGLSQ